MIWALAVVMLLAILGGCGSSIATGLVTILNPTISEFVTLGCDGVESEIVNQTEKEVVAIVCPSVAPLVTLLLNAYAASQGGDAGALAGAKADTSRWLVTGIDPSIPTAGAVRTVVIGQGAAQFVAGHLTSGAAVPLTPSNARPAGKVTPR